MWFKFLPHPLCDFSFMWVDGNTFSHSWQTLWKSLWGRCTHTCPFCFCACVFDILSPVFITCTGFLGRMPMFLASHFIVSTVTSGSLSHTGFLWVFVSDFILRRIEIQFSQCSLLQWFLLEHSFCRPYEDSLGCRCAGLFLRSWCCTACSLVSYLTSLKCCLSDSTRALYRNSKVLC